MQIKFVSVRHRSLPTVRCHIVREPAVESSRVQVIPKEKVHHAESIQGRNELLGSNTVYITDGEGAVQKLENHAYEVKAQKDQGSDIHVSTGVVVALGDYSDLPDAIAELKIVLKRMRADLKASGCDKCPHCGTLIYRCRHRVKPKKVIQYG